MQRASEIHPDTALGLELLERLEKLTADHPGVTRTAYGTGEEAAHRLVIEVARTFQAHISQDFAGNTYLTRVGRDRGAGTILIGSHMDSVPHGGNYDGAAGVAAGIAVLAGLSQAGVELDCSVGVMAIRAEESCWFPASYIGSRMALGRLAPAEVDRLLRSDTQRPLAAHMADLGFDPEAVRRGTKHLDPRDIACYIEPHIEQGPVLEAEAFPVAIVEAITGGPRFRDAKILGEYAHAGAAPRAYRHDAVAALGDLITGINELWEELERLGHYSVFTFGIVGTDPSMHTFSRVPGEARFCLDTRGIRPETLTLIHAGLHDLITRVERKHGVKIELGADSGPAIAMMDAAIQERLVAAAHARGIHFRLMPSGAGHDAAAFAAAGVRTGMVFIRNQHGSHNSDEGMQADDFDAACRLLTEFVVSFQPLRQ
jgi:N-carbamoyl-L-amino-acid hydrolase